MNKQKKILQSNRRSSDESLTFVAIVSCHRDCGTKNEDGGDERSCLLTNTDSSTKNPRNLRHFALDADMKLIARNSVERGVASSRLKLQQEKKLFRLFVLCLPITKRVSGIFTQFQKTNFLMLHRRAFKQFL